MIRSFRVASLLAFTSIIRGNIGVILLTVLVLALISLMSLFVPSLLSGLVSGANTQLRNTYSSDIVVESDTTNPLLDDVTDIVSKIESINGVLATAERNSLGAELTFKNNRTEAIIYGVQPDKEKQVFTIRGSLVEGSYLSPDDMGEIMLGMQLAGADNQSLEFYNHSLQEVHAGDELVVTYGNGVQKKYIVKGIFYTEFIQTDLQAYVTQKEFQTVNPLTANRANSIHVKIRPDTDISHISDQINSIRNNLKIMKWEDFAGIIRGMTDSFNVINTILTVVNLLIAGTTVFIVTYIDVTNRRRQIGVQRAIGITPRSITLSYLMRAVLYAITAIILAILFFLFVVAPLEAKYPFHFPFGEVYLTLGAKEIFRMAVIVLGVSLLASLLPVRNAMMMKIMDAIWG